MTKVPRYVISYADHLLHPSLATMFSTIHNYTKQLKGLYLRSISTDLCCFGNKKRRCQFLTWTTTRMSWIFS